MKRIVIVLPLSVFVEIVHGSVVADGDKIAAVQPEVLDALLAQLRLLEEHLRVLQKLLAGLLAVGGNQRAVLLRSKDRNKLRQKRQDQECGKPSS